MKNLFLILAFVGIFLSCTEEDKAQIQPELIGKWVWVQSSGGIAGVVNTPKTTGNQITIEFTESTLKKYVNGKLVSETSYRIETSTSIRKTEKTVLIIYDNEFKQSIELKGNMLILYDECYDCFQNEYLRVKN